jgi:GT2 family glycosyltransferase
MVPPAALTDTVLERILAPAAEVLHSQAMARPATPEVIEIGQRPATAEVSVIIPLYRNLSFLRLQIGAFAVDPEARRALEIVYVLDSPEQRAEVEHLLRGLSRLTGLGFRLVVMGANRGYAAANNAGVRHATCPTLVLMNSDVVPIGPGWLAPLLASLAEAGVGAVGPKLLFDDGSLQHAGLTFERDVEGHWYNTHFHKGYPRGWPAANVARSVPAVTGACLVTPRALYEAVGGFSEDYIIGDFEDSDLCLRIRAAGHDIRYAPAAELYHFERRSIALHPGYARSAASAYNRRLHGQRWADAIAALAHGTGAR